MLGTAMSATALLERGEVIADRYRIESAVGQGGMAVVYRAHHIGTDKPCALKLLQGRWLDDDELLDRFLKEARIIGRIGSHPNIVDVFDAGIDEAHEIPYIAMELLSGDTLSRYLERWAPLPHGEARSILAQLASALDEAHGAGVIHRDLKAANIFVVPDVGDVPRIKVLDFGIAKESEHSGTATMIGTPTCSAPEQLGNAMRELAAERGVTISRGVSPQTDVWALGLLAYQIFTGLGARQYWDAAHSSDVMVKVALGERPLPTNRAGARASHLPAGFDGWFMRCTASNASERWASASVAVAALFAAATDAEPGDVPVDEGDRPSGVRVQPTLAGRPADVDEVVRGREAATQATPISVPPARGRAESTVLVAPEVGRARWRLALVLSVAATAALLAALASSDEQGEPSRAQPVLRDRAQAGAMVAKLAIRGAARAAALSLASPPHPTASAVAGAQTSAPPKARPPAVAAPPATPPPAKKDDFDVLFGKR